MRPTYPRRIIRSAIKDLGGAFDQQGSSELVILSLSLTTELIIGCHAVATLNLHIVSNAE